MIRNDTTAAADSAGQAIGQLEQIAKKHLSLDTLSTRGSDSQDFYNVAVWNVKAALEEAVELGRALGPNGQRDILFDGRWKEPEATRAGELAWSEPGKGGLQTCTATVVGKPVATIRKHLHRRGYSVQVPGWVWAQPLAGSAAAKIGVKETHVKTFPSLRDAKAAVKYAWDRLPPSVVA